MAKLKNRPLVRVVLNKIAKQEGGEFGECARDEKTIRIVEKLPNQNLIRLNKKLKTKKICEIKYL